MSNTQAIAVTSGVIEARIRALLKDAGLEELSVTAKMPSGETPADGVYFQAYRVTPNPSLRGLDLPTRRADGSLSRKPRLAIDVDYAVSFVGDASEFEAEHLAALVLTDFHANAFLSPTEINEFVDAEDSPLPDADLGDQLERVKLTLIPLSLEDLSRVWGLGNQSFYALTVAFSASIIILDAEVEPIASRPVVDPQVHVGAQAGPIVHSVRSSARPQAVVAIDGTTTEALIIEGQNLAGSHTALQIGDSLVPVPIAAVSGTRIELPITAALGLRSGATSVSVVHQIDVDPPSGDLRMGASSNALPLVLLPEFADTSPTATAVGDDVDIRVTVTPVPADDQDVTLLLDQVGGQTHASSQARVAEPGALVFRVEDVPTGTYLLRLRVDGAVTIPSSSGSGALDTPAVTVP